MLGETITKQGSRSKIYKNQKMKPHDGYRSRYMCIILCVYKMIVRLLGYVDASLNKSCICECRISTWRLFKYNSLHILKSKPNTTQATRLFYLTHVFGVKETYFMHVYFAYAIKQVNLSNSRTCTRACTYMHIDTHTFIFTFTHGNMLTQTHGTSLNVLQSKTDDLL